MDWTCCSSFKQRDGTTLSTRGWDSPAALRGSEGSLLSLTRETTRQVNYSRLFLSLSPPAAIRWSPRTAWRWHGPASRRKSQGSHPLTGWRIALIRAPPGANIFKKITHQITHQQLDNNILQLDQHPIARPCPLVALVCPVLFHWSIHTPHVCCSGSYCLDQAEGSWCLEITPQLVPGSYP